MKFTKLFCLLCLGVSLVGCQREDRTLMECVNYEGKLACYLDTTDDREVLRFSNELLERGYGDFIIQTNDGYIEFKLGILYEEVK